MMDLIQTDAIPGPGLWQREWELARRGWTVAGVDEAGRGPLAGPVVAGAVILPPGVMVPGLNDSKKLSARQRQRLDACIRQEARDWAVGMAEAREIDALGLVSAVRLAVKRAVDALKVRPQYLLVDCHALPAAPWPGEQVVRGDQLHAAIAAASIVAKEARDGVMCQWHCQLPQYGFDRHKGYGTLQHMEALSRWGPSAIHRLSFRPVQEAARRVRPGPGEEP